MSERSGASAGGEPVEGKAKPPKGIVRLWLKVGGWMVTGIGFLTVISALRSYHVHHWPFLVVIGLVLMGAAYAMAGMAFSESRRWSIPLALLSGLTYSAFPPYGFGFVLSFALGVTCIGAAAEEAFEDGIDQNAQMAFGLWLAGLAIMLVYWAFTW